MARAAEADARAGPAAGIFGWRYGPERIDESELDAALALADLARAAGAVGCQIRRSRDGGRVDHSGEIPASDLAQSNRMDDRDRFQKTYECHEEESIKFCQGSESPKSRHKDPTTRVSLNSGKLNEILTAAEKESKKLRRILANRESARQTIRRRQVVLEELSKKAVDLACDNDNMKCEKGLLLKEYETLKDRNEHLREEIGKRVVDNISESSSEDATTPTTSSLSWLSMPYAFKLSDSSAPKEVCGDSDGRKHPVRMAKHSSFAINPKADSSKTEVALKDEEVMPAKSWEASNVTIRPGRGTTLISTSSTSLPTISSVKSEKLSPIGMDLLAPHTSTSNPQIKKTGKSLSGAASSYLNKRLIDGVMAAEARKRRKELTKLKHLCYRQHRMGC